MNESLPHGLEERVEATLERLLRPVMERLEKKLEIPAQAWLSVQATAALTGLSTKHIRRAVNRGELPCSNLGGEKRSTLRIAKRDIDGWFEANRLKQCPGKADRDALANHYFGEKRKTRGRAAV